MEHVNGVHLLAGTYKLDWLGYHGTDTEGSTTAGITIELGENNAVEVEAVVKFLGCVYGILTGHGVNHEEGFVWTEMILEIADLVHHLLINGETSGCIDDYHIVAVGLSLLDGMVGDTEHILVLWLAVYRNTHLLTHYMELLDSCRTVNVAGHEQWLLAFLGLEHIGKLSAEGSLTRTLQTAHEDDGRMTFELQWGFFAAHKFFQFIVHQLDHQLSRLYSSKYIHAECFLLHLVGEFLSHFIVYVGVEECTAHILHGFRHVDFCNFSLALQDFERAFQSIT